MMAAHDTSTITLALMGYYLGRHPQWQDRLREESLALGKPHIGFDDLDRLPITLRRAEGACRRGGASSDAGG